MRSGSAPSARRRAASSACTHKCDICSWGQDGHWISASPGPLMTPWRTFAGLLRARRLVMRHLSAGTSDIEQLRYSSHKLRWRERLFQKDAVGYSLGRPIVGGRAGYVDDGECGIDLSDQARNLPSFHRS